MIVVSDASPVICLSAVGQLELLQQRYGRVWIPEAVHNEISRAEAGQPGVEELRAASWISVESVRNEVLVRALDGEVDRGVLAAAGEHR